MDFCADQPYNKRYFYIGGVSIMGEKKKKSHLIAKVALIFSIISDATYIVIEIIKLLLNK